MKILIAAAMALLVPTALAARADGSISPPAAQQASSHARLAEAINARSVHEAAIEAVLRDMRTVMMRDPNLVLMERRCEGLVDSIMAVSGPLIIEYGNVERSVTRAEMAALFEEELTGEEARQLAAFYESESGQRILSGVNANLNFEKSIAGSVPSGPDMPVRIDERDAESDTRRMVAGMISGLSQEELEEIEREIVAIPAFPKFEALAPQVTALRLEIANRDLIPGFNERLDAAMNTAIAAQMETCGL
ncbi:DUF2059 domain-containing protein [Alteriqipengyuania lutimaris]|nr:DUF2059 domain-containing protein [Alteriqipengyuania lutimaris]MBB3034928.1 hypothetical protein [Alteriqipengyuania lutimaris]